MNGLHAAFDEYVADVSGYGDLDRAIDQAALERRRSGLVAVVAATVAVLLVIAGVLATSRDGREALQPVGPSPKATTSASAKATEWPGAIRSGTSWPVVSDKRLGPPGNAWRGRIDGRDSAVGEIDIRILSGLRLSRSGCASPCWILGLQADPPRETPRAAAPVIEYGVIVDTDGDRVGDCELGLTTDAPGGEYRAWLTNLRSGATDEQIGPPYGYPFDFSILSKAGEERQSAVFFYFLNGVWRKPCERPDGPIEWYAYASLTEEDASLRGTSRRTRRGSGRAERPLMQAGRLQAIEGWELQAGSGRHRQMSTSSSARARPWS